MRPLALAIALASGCHNGSAIAPTPTCSPGYVQRHFDNRHSPVPTIWGGTVKAITHVHVTVPAGGVASALCVPAGMIWTPYPQN